MEYHLCNPPITENRSKSIKTPIQVGLSDDETTLAKRKATYGENIPVTKP